MVIDVQEKGFNIFKIFRNTCVGVFFKTCLLQSFAQFTEKLLFWGLLVKKIAYWGPGTLIKNTREQASSCVFCKVFRNICFVEHLRTTAHRFWKKTWNEGFLLQFKFSSISGWTEISAPYANFFPKNFPKSTKFANVSVFIIRNR